MVIVKCVLHSKQTSDVSSGIHFSSPMFVALETIAFFEDGSGSLDSSARMSSEAEREEELRLRDEECDRDRERGDPTSSSSSTKGGGRMIKGASELCSKVEV